MKKFTFIICSGLVFIPLSACGQTDSEENIVQDVEVQQFDEDYGFQQRANNADQNENQMTNPELTFYANQAGSYISETATLLEKTVRLFEVGAPTATDIDEALATIQELKRQSQSFLTFQPPEAFEGFHHVHVATLVEIDALEKVLMEITEPIHPIVVTNARVHYENAVVSHKLMEREYLSITEEYGLH